MTGEVFDGSRTYSVRPLSNGRHRIYEINPAALPENTPAPRSIYGTTNRNNRDAGDVDVVRLMIVLHRNANSVADSKTGGVGAAIVAPGVPENMSGSANGSTVNLSWNAPASGDPPAEYLLEAGSFPGASDIYDASVGNTTGVTATDVGAGTYYVRVRARNAAGTSAPSNEVELVVGGGGAGLCSSAPGAPLQLTWSANGSTVTLNWNAPRVRTRRPHTSSRRDQRQDQLTSRLQTSGARRRSSWQAGWGQVRTTYASERRIRAARAQLLTKQSWSSATVAVEAEAGHRSGRASILLESTSRLAATSPIR